MPKTALPSNPRRPCLGSAAIVGRSGTSTPPVSFSSSPRSRSSGSWRGRSFVPTASRRRVPTCRQSSAWTLLPRKRRRTAPAVQREPPHRLVGPRPLAPKHATHDPPTPCPLRNPPSCPRGPPGRRTPEAGALEGGIRVTSVRAGIVVREFEVRCLHEGHPERHPGRRIGSGSLGLISSTTGIRTAYRTIDGSVRIPMDRAALVSIVVRTDRGRPRFQGAIRMAPKGEAPRRIEVALDESAETGLEGTLTDARGDPVGRARIHYRPHQSGDPNAIDFFRHAVTTATTDHDGFYRATGLIPSDHGTLEVERGGQVVLHRPSVQVVPGRLSRVDLRLDPSRVAIVVVTWGRRPLPHVRLRATGDARNPMPSDASSVTANDGVAELHFPPATSRVRIDIAGFARWLASNPLDVPRPPGPNDSASLRDLVATFLHYAVKDAAVDIDFARHDQATIDIAPVIAEALEAQSRSLASALRPKLVDVPHLLDAGILTSLASGKSAPFLAWLERRPLDSLRPSPAPPPSGSRRKPDSHRRKSLSPIHLHRSVSACDGAAAPSGSVAGRRC